MRVVVRVRPLLSPAGRMEGLGGGVQGRGLRPTGAGAVPATVRVGVRRAGAVSALSVGRVGHLGVVRAGVRVRVGICAPLSVARGHILVGCAGAGAVAGLVAVGILGRGLRVDG